MSEEALTTGSKRRNIIVAAIAAVAVVAAVGFYIYSSVCPCERTPGGFLLGERSEQAISDWSFVNDVPLCQIQVWAGIRPHSVNLNCMATAEGKLYLSCSFCDSKYWASKVGTDENGRIKLNGIVYPVVFNRVMDPDELDRAWAARVAKLQVHGGPGNPAPPPDAQRADRWWSFNLVSAI
jgi:hypothetical protein